MGKYADHALHLMYGFNGFNTHNSAHVAGKQQQLNCQSTVYHNMSVCVRVRVCVCLSVAVNHLVREDMWVLEW